jgi:hypothetical protein
MKHSFHPTIPDLFLSAGMALLFPLLAGVLLMVSGALLPMVLYYSAAWGISIWRRGASGYRLKKLPSPPVSFYIQLFVIAVALILSYFARIKVTNPAIVEVVLTAVVWAVVNASSEQLLWIYIFDAWDLYKKDEFSVRSRILMRISGCLLFTVFVGTIHTMYWAKILHTVNSGTIIGILFIVATTISGYLHVVVWRQSSRMIYTFIPHFLLNLVPLFWTGYSIFPYLLATF